MQDLCLAKSESLATSTPLGTVSLGKLPQGKHYRLKRVQIRLASGAVGSVEVRILQGDTVLTPDNGVFESDLEAGVSEAQKDLAEGAELFVQRKNSSGTTAYRYYVIVDLEETSA